LNIGILHGQIIDTAIERSISDIIHRRYDEFFEPTFLVRRNVERNLRRIQLRFPGLYEPHRELCIGRILIAQVASASSICWTAADAQSISIPSTLHQLRRRAAAYLARDPNGNNNDDVEHHAEPPRGNGAEAH
jgi:hypothetical protein